MAEMIDNTGHVHHKEYGSKATANAGLTLGIIGTALAVLNGNGNFLGGILGNKPSPSSDSPIPNTAETAYIERTMCQNYLVTTKQYYEGQIAQMKDLNAASLEAAMSMIAGTARSMGITVVD